MEAQVDGSTAGGDSTKASVTTGQATGQIPTPMLFVVPSAVPSLFAVLLTGTVSGGGMQGVPDPDCNPH